MKYSTYIFMIFISAYLPFIIGVTTAGEMFISMLLVFILNMLNDIRDEIKKVSK
jgi:hypothetical protein